RAESIGRALPPGPLSGRVESWLARPACVALVGQFPLEKGFARGAERGQIQMFICGFEVGDLARLLFVLASDDIFFAHCKIGHKHLCVPAVSWNLNTVLQSLISLLLFLNTL